jgi:hypothetical protein
MQRRSFFKLSGIALPIASVPYVHHATLGNKDRLKDGFVVVNGKDRHDTPITLLEGDVFFTKIGTCDTEGDVFIFESTRKVNGGPR